MKKHRLFYTSLSFISHFILSEAVNKPLTFQVGLSYRGKLRIAQRTGVLWKRLYLIYGEIQIHIFSQSQHSLVDLGKSFSQPTLLYKVVARIKMHKVPF